MSEKKMSDKNRESKEAPAIKRNTLRMKVLSHETHFTFQEIEAVTHMHKCLCEHYGGPIDRNLFCDFCQNCFGLYDMFLLNRLFKAMDKDEDNSLNVSEWVKGLDTLLLGSLEELANITFQVYSDGWPKISRNDFLYLTRRFLPTRDSFSTDVVAESYAEQQEVITAVREIALSLLDLDGDGEVSMEDFVEAVKREPLLLECLGECLPSADARSAFLGLIQTSPFRTGELTYLDSKDFESFERMTLINRLGMIKKRSEGEGEKFGVVEEKETKKPEANRSPLVKVQSNLDDDD